MKKLLLLALLLCAQGSFALGNEESVALQANLARVASAPGAYPLTGQANFLLSGSMLNFELFIRFEGIYVSTAEIEGPSSRFRFDLGPALIVVHSPGPWPNGYDGATIYRGSFEVTQTQIEDLLSGWSILTVLGVPQGDLHGRICPLPPAPDGDCDGDGVPNEDDLCPNTPPGSVVDATGCSIAELVPCNGPWKNHNQYVKAVREEAFRFWKEGRISARERNAIVKQAEKSTCGEPPPRPVFPGVIIGPVLR
jgi:hypothetical protein